MRVALQGLRAWTGTAPHHAEKAKRPGRADPVRVGSRDNAGCLEQRIDEARASIEQPLTDRWCPSLPAVTWCDLLPKTRCRWRRRQRELVVVDCERESLRFHRSRSCSKARGCSRRKTVSAGREPRERNARVAHAAYVSSQSPRPASSNSRPPTCPLACTAQHDSASTETPSDPSSFGMPTLRVTGSSELDFEVDHE